MKTVRIRVSSSTYAQKGRRLLWERGIRASVRSALSTEGCGKVLEVALDREDAARRILAEGGVRVLS